MSANDRTSPSRPLLIGGEALGNPIDRSSGGGAPQSPQTFDQARARLVGQVAATAEMLQSLPDELRAARLILEATVLPNFLATGHFPTSLFEEAGVVAVGARATRGVYETPNQVTEDAPARILVLSADEASLTRLSAAIEQGRTDQIQDDVATLESITPPTPARILRRSTREPILVDGRLAMEGVLNPAVDANGRVDSRTQTETFEKWRAWIERLGGELDPDWVRPQAGMLFTPVLLPPEHVEDAVQFNPLRVLRPAARVRPLPIGPMRSIGGLRPPPPSAGPLSDTSIAIFDGQPAESVPAFEPYLTFTDLTGNAPNLGEAIEHATTVTSAALFGNIDAAAGLSPPPTGVDVYRIWPPPPSERPDLDLIWVLDRISWQLTQSDYRLVSLSVAPEINIEDDGEPHVWSTTLDELAAQRGIVFCVAVGNSGQEDSGLDRVQVPSDMANGLAIGASDTADMNPWTRAPYSCVGPGRPGASVCPLVVGGGGHLDANTPFTCLIPGGQFGHSEGTSLAAPAAARTLAEIAAALGNRSSPNNLRALAVHFAEAHAELGTREVGYGRMPSTLLPEMTCAPNEATLLYDDVLERGQTITLPLPVPPDMLEDMGGAFITFRWTLVFNTPVSANDPVDYGQSGIEVFFRPNSQRFNMTLQGMPPIAVDLRHGYDRDFRDYLVNEEGRAPSDRPVTRGKNEYAPETERRADGKWETVIRVDDRMRASGLHEPALDVHLLTRRDGRLTAPSAPDTLNYSLLVSFWAPENVELYERVRAYAPVLQPLPVTLPVQIDGT